MSPGLKAKQGEQPVGFEIDQGFGHIAQAADELEVFQAGQVRVDVRFFGDVPEGGPVGL